MKLGILGRQYDKCVSALLQLALGFNPLSRLFFSSLFLSHVFTVVLSRHTSPPASLQYLLSTFL